MKKITLLLLMMCFTFSFSQTQTEILNLPFDAAASISTWTTVADAATFPTEASISFNASGNPTGALECTGVLDIANSANGRSYQYFYQDNAFDFGNASTLEISLDIKIDVALANTNLQFQTQVSKVGGGVAVTNTDNIQNGLTLGTWTTLTFNMTPNAAEFDNNGNLLIFFFNMAAGAIDGAGGTIFVDNVIITATENPPTCDDGIQNGNETGLDCGGPDCAACIEAPTVGPDAPTIPQAEVLSVYSDTYTTDVTNLNLLAFAQNNANFSQPSLSGNNAVRIEDYAFYGAGWDAVDVSSFDFIHVDYYAQTATSFQFFALDASLGTTICCGNAEEPRYFVGGPNADVPLVQGQWQSINIPLSAFENYAALINGTWDGTDIREWKFEGQGILYFDNVYFGLNSSLSNDEFNISQFNVSPNPTNNVWEVNASVNIDTINVFDILGKRVVSLSPNSQKVSIDASNLRTGIYLAQFSSNGATKTVKLIKN